jgi:biotin transport system permease protein
VSLLGLYRPGSTLWHRLSAGAKLGLLFVLGIVVAVLHGPRSGLALLAGVLVVCAWSRMGLRVLARTLGGLALISVTLAAYLAWQQSVPRAVEVVADLWTLVLAATVVTSTTPLDQMLDAFVTALRPLRAVGVDPERVGLAFSLMIRAIPTTIGIAEETRDAALARGLQRSPRARLVPLVIRTIAHARATGEALDARGIGDRGD